MNSYLLVPAGEGRLAHRLEEAARLVQSGFMPPGLRTPAAVVAAAAYAEALGVDPRLALLGEQIWVTPDGRLGMKSGMLQGLAVRAGCTLTYPERTSEAVTCEVRRGDVTYTARWTLEDAESAGLLAPTRAGKDRGWLHYARARLTARAAAEACRLACPDVLAGAFTPEDLVVEPEPEPEEVVRDLGAATEADAVTTTYAEPEPETTLEEMGEALATADELHRGHPPMLGRWPDGVDRTVGERVAVSSTPRLDRVGRPVCWGSVGGRAAPFYLGAELYWAHAAPDATAAVPALRRWHDLVRGDGPDVVPWSRLETDVERYAELVAELLAVPNDDERRSCGRRLVKATGCHGEELCRWLERAIATKSLVGERRYVLALALAATEVVAR